MKITKHIIIRILAIAIPLLLLYFYSEMVFEANRQREHRTDAGLGIVFLLVFVLIILMVVLLQILLSGFIRNNILLLD